MFTEIIHNWNLVFHLSAILLLMLHQTTYNINFYPHLPYMSQKFLQLQSPHYLLDTRPDKYVIHLPT